MKETSTLNHYELTWNRFIKELDSNPKATLHSVCKIMDTDYESMRRWAYRIGHSAAKERASHGNKESEKISSSAFSVIVPNDNTSVHTDSPLLGVSITFNSGITVNINQTDADSIIRLVSLYERKDGGACIL